MNLVVGRGEKYLIAREKFGDKMHDIQESKNQSSIS